MPKPQLNPDVERYEDINNPPLRPEAHTKHPTETNKKWGRPSVYCTAWNHVAFQLALLGAIEETYLAAFQISVGTFYRWKKDYPEFAQAIARGGEIADAKVAHCLFERATGYTYDSEQLAYDRELKGFVRADTRIHYPPDVAAQIKWLALRQREKWSEVTRTELTGPNGERLIPPVINILPIKANSQG